MIEAELPDGTVLEFPDGTSTDVVQRVVKQRIGVKSEPTIGQSTRQAAGNILAGAVRGAGSIGATLLAPWDVAQDALAGKGLSLESNRQRRASMDAALGQLGAETDSFGYGAGKLAGEIAGTAGAGGVLARGASMLPGAARAAPVIDAIRTGGMSAGGLTGATGMAARTAGGALTGGVSAGMVDPSQSGAGALIGGAAPGVIKAMGAVGRGIGSQFAPSGALSDVAQDALKRGAPLGVADIAEGKFTKALRSVLNDAPLSGGIGAKQTAAKQEWFNRAVGETFDAANDKLTPQVLDTAKKKMGAEFDRIWGSNALNVDNTMLQSMSQARKNASMLPKAERTRVMSVIDDLENQVIPGPNGQMVIPGDVANRYQSKIREIADSATGFLKNDMTALRKDIISAFNRSVSPEDAAALALNQGKYKAFKTVEPLLAKGEAGVAGREAGDVPASLLSNAVFQSYGGNVSKSELGKLAKIGSQFLVDRTPQTGGSARAAIQNSAIGGALGVGALTNPLALAAIPAAMGVNKALGSPMLARSVMRQAAKPATQGLLDQSIYYGLPVMGAGLLSGQ